MQALRVGILHPHSTGSVSGRPCSPWPAPPTCLTYDRRPWTRFPTGALGTEEPPLEGGVSGGRQLPDLVTQALEEGPGIDLELRNNLGYDLGVGRSLGVGAPHRTPPWVPDAPSLSAPLPSDPCRPPAGEAAAAALPNPACGWMWVPRSRQAATFHGKNVSRPPRPARP